MSGSNPEDVGSNPTRPAKLDCDGWLRERYSTIVRADCCTYCHDTGTGILLPGPPGADWCVVLCCAVAVQWDVFWLKQIRVVRTTASTPDS